MIGAHLRRMQAGDLPSVMAIDALCLPRPWSAAIWRGELASPYRLYLVIEDGGEISGHIGVRHVLGELHITTIAVRPEYRRRGQARAMIGAALAAYPNAGHVHLEVRPDQHGSGSTLRVARLQDDRPQAALLRRRGRPAHDPEPRPGSFLERRRSSRLLRISSLRRCSASGGSNGFNKRSAGTTQARKETKMPPAITGSTGPLIT